MRPFALFYLTDVRYGGFATYAAHLHRSLRAAGYQPLLMKVRKRTERRERHLTHGVGYRNVDLATALATARACPSLIVCAYWSQYAQPLRALLGAGARLVLHDPTEFHDEVLALCRTHRTRVVAVRWGNAEALVEQGIDATFVPHPYVEHEFASTVERGWHALSLSRIDWDKHTEVIALANEQLPAERCVRIFGAVNRLYVHHRLSQRVPTWAVHYHGAFPQHESAAVEMASRAKFVVDMSVIAGDGDGTQYTFLEAWDAGAHLVVNRGWLRSGTGAVRDGVTATAVGDAGELAAVLRGEPDATVVANGRAQLAAHAPAVVVPQLLRAMR